MVAEHLAGIKAGAVGDELGGAGIGQFDDEGPQVLLEPGPPGELDDIAGLQSRRELAGPAAADEAKMPATALDHDLGDDRCLSVPPHADDQAFTGPLHKWRTPDSQSGFPPP